MPPFPADEVVRTITEDLGRPPGQVFEHFDERPLSAASVGQVHACTLPDGRHMLAADEGSIVVIELLTNEIKKTLKFPRGNLQCLAAYPDGKYFAAGGTDGMVHWWSVKADQPRSHVDFGEQRPVTCVAVSPDRRYIAG